MSTGIDPTAAITVGEIKDMKTFDDTDDVCVK
jgi:hypothetical protein